MLVICGSRQILFDMGFPPINQNTGESAMRTFVTGPAAEKGGSGKTPIVKARHFVYGARNERHLREPQPRQQQRQNP
jgi:hypothetical protein